MMNDNATVEVERVNVRPMEILPPSISLGLFFARVPLGAYFILAGGGKVFKIGLGEFVSGNLQGAMRFLSESMARLYLTTLPFIEIVVGVLLVIGLLTRVAGGVATLLLASFVIGATGIWGPPGSWLFHQNLVFLGVTLLLLLAGGGRLSADTALWGRRGIPAAGTGPGVTDATVTTRVER